MANECKAQAAFATRKREAEMKEKTRVHSIASAGERLFARREAQKLRQFAKLKIEAKLYARKRVENASKQR